MPLPKPGKDEKQSAFVDRCMSNEVMKEYGTNKQRLAVCFSQWRRKDNQLLTVNLKQDWTLKKNDVALETVTPQSREETLGGRKYLVAPVVAIVEGVLNEWYVTARAIEQSASKWNGVPLTINHPKDEEDQPVSAMASQDTLDSVQVGFFENVHYDSTIRALVGEAWIDIDKALDNAEGQQTIQRILDQLPLEVSTGYYVPHLENTSGEFNGKKFKEVHHLLDPDHLALLPNETGACSWQDGCGIPRLNDDSLLDEEGADAGATGDGSFSDEASCMTDPDMMAQYPDDAARAEACKGKTKAAQVANHLKTFCEEHGLEIAKLHDRTVVVFATEGVEAEKQKTLLQQFCTEHGLTLQNGTEVVKSKVNEECSCHKQGKRAEKSNDGVNDAANPSQSAEPGSRYGGPLNNKQKVEMLIKNRNTRFGPEDEAWLLTLKDEQLDRLMPTDSIDKSKREPRVNTLITKGQFPETDREWLMDMDEVTFGKIEGKALEQIRAEEQTVAARVNKAIQNGRYQDEDRGWLMQLSGDKLDRALAETRPIGSGKGKQNQMTEEQYLAQAPGQLGNTLRKLMEQDKQTRAQLLRDLKANENCFATADELEDMTTEQLSRLAKSYDIDSEDDYSGLGSGNLERLLKENSGSDDEDDQNSVPPPPRWMTKADTKK